MIVQLTTNLPVDNIEPSVAFFAKVGFATAMRLPDKGPMTFAILANGVQQLMFQTRRGLADDHAAFQGGAIDAQIMLYITVEDAEGMASKLKEYKIVMDWRTTEYGAKEITFKEPGGHLVTFAQFPDMFL